MSTPRTLLTGKRRVVSEPNGRQYSMWPIVDISDRQTGYWVEEHHTGSGSGIRTYYVTGCGITRSSAEPYRTMDAAMSAHERRA